MGQNHACHLAGLPGAEGSCKYSPIVLSVIMGWLGVASVSGVNQSSPLPSLPKLLKRAIQMPGDKGEHLTFSCQSFAERLKAILNRH